MVRVFNNSDGTVRILRLNPKNYPNLTALDFALETAKDETLKDLPWADVDENDIPLDRSKRNKWRQVNKQGKDMIGIEIAPVQFDFTHIKPTSEQ